MTKLECDIWWKTDMVILSKLLEKYSIQIFFKHFFNEESK